MRDDYTDAEALAAAHPTLQAFDDYAEDEDLPFELDQWEDGWAIKEQRKKYPGWMIMKVSDYHPRTLSGIQEWCRENCKGKWAKIGWHSDCAYTVAMAFEDYRDAILYKMRWQS